ncbi:unnamed protein product [Pelagomonas calceolata]|uniref:Uncharacterized protein n=2 Tax=Pelagomonas calceolata TaxID=35677 RepID=A0A8J2X0D2_9STRA|nr:unnamed protein product [Pelagomonas calceolata]
MASPATSPAGDTTQQEAVQLACLALTKPGDAGAAASAAVLGAATLAFRRSNDQLKLGNVTIQRVYPAFDGADIINGDTMLHAAVRRQLHDVTSALLEAGAPLGVRNMNGETAFEIVTAPAPQEEDPELERALAESRRQAEEDEAQLAAALAASALESTPRNEGKAPDADDDLQRALEASKKESTPQQQQQKGFFGRWFGKSEPEDDLDAAVAASLAAEDEDVRRRRESEDEAMARALAESEAPPAGTRPPPPPPPPPPAASLAAAAAAAGRKPRAAPSSPPKRKPVSNVHPLAAAAAAEVARRPRPPSSPTLSRRPAAPSALAEALAAAAAKRKQKGPPKSPTRKRVNPFQRAQPPPPPEEATSPLHARPSEAQVNTSKRIAELEATVAALRSELNRVKKPTEKQQQSIDDIESELRAATARCLQGDPSAESELERLDAALRAHPDHKIRQAKARANWDSEQRTANNNALALTRSLVPPDILKSTAKDVGLRICDALQSDDKPALALARRVWSAKALRAVRAPSELLRKAHVADLRGTYTPTGLDIVELRAVYACLPREFANDGDGAKAAWRESVREKLVAMVAKEASGSLTPAEKRNSAYQHLPDFVRLFPSEACDAGWRPDAADPLTRPARPRAAPAGLLAALQGRSRVGV